MTDEEEIATPDGGYEVIEAEGEAEVLAITACPSGVAHTFLAAKSLQKAAAKAGIKLKVETQGANGIINRITAKDVANARCVYLFTRTGLTASVLPGWDNLSSRCTP